MCCLFSSFYCLSACVVVVVCCWIPVPSGPSELQLLGSPSRDKRGGRRRKKGDTKKRRENKREIGLVQNVGHDSGRYDGFRVRDCFKHRLAAKTRHCDSAVAHVNHRSGSNGSSAHNSSTCISYNPFIFSCLLLFLLFPFSLFLLVECVRVCSLLFLSRILKGNLRLPMVGVTPHRKHVSKAGKGAVWEV